MEWLYLIHPEHDAIAVYEATAKGRWHLHSRHRLSTGDDDLFRLDGTTIVCTGCACADEVQFATAPAPGSDDVLTIVRCPGCGRAEITDAQFITSRVPAR